MIKCNKKCEVFTRCCGYFRPVSNFNRGKTSEVKDRVEFLNGVKGNKVGGEHLEY